MNMKLLIAAVTLALTLVLSGDTHAQEANLVACKPFVNGDGTQVLETFAVSKEMCEKPHAAPLIRIADFKEYVMCSYRGDKCVRYQHMNPAMKTQFNELMQVYLRHNGKKEGCVQTDGRTFRTEMVPTPGGFGCGANISSIRHYDYLLNTVSFLDGKGKVIDVLDIGNEFAPF